MNRISQHVDDETWDGVPMIERVEVSARETFVQYIWWPGQEDCTRYWSRTLHSSGVTYLRKGKKG